MAAVHATLRKSVIWMDLYSWCDAAFTCRCSQIPQLPEEVGGQAWRGCSGCTEDKWPCTVTLRMHDHAAVQQSTLFYGHLMTKSGMRNTLTSSLPKHLAPYIEACQLF